MHVQCQKISITIKTFHQNNILLDTRIREHHQRTYNTGPVTKTQQCQNMNIESWLGRNLQVNFAAKALLQKHVYVFYHFNCWNKHVYVFYHFNCWNLGYNSSLQNRLVRWGVPPFYKLFSRVLSIRRGTKSTPSKPTQWRCWRLQWRLTKGRNLGD